MKDADIRKRVKTLKALYMEAASYVGVNALFILIWLIFDRSETFWPKYVLLIWGILLVFKAYRKNLFPFFFSRISFLTPEWENKKVDELMGRRHHQRKIQLKRDLRK